MTSAPSDHPVSTPAVSSENSAGSGYQIRRFTAGRTADRSTCPTAR